MTYATFTVELLQFIHHANFLYTLQSHVKNETWLLLSFLFNVMLKAHAQSYGWTCYQKKNLIVEDTPIWVFSFI